MSYVCLAWKKVKLVVGFDAQSTCRSCQSVRRKRVNVLTVTVVFTNLAHYHDLAGCRMVGGY